MSAPHDLLPDLKDWNDGGGISPLDWVFCTKVSSELVTGMTALFWPTFVMFEGYVLREDFSESHVRNWEGAAGSSREMVEATVNTLYMEDLFDRQEAWTPLVKARAVHLIGVLAGIHRLKLANDFPDRRFEVEAFDGSQPGGEISLSFWQV